ncbi:hypothetical protein [Rubritalea tangerina]
MSKLFHFLRTQPSHTPLTHSTLTEHFAHPHKISIDATPLIDYS